MLRRLSIAFGCQTLLLVTALHAAEIGTAFTYQGTLENGSGPVTDTCDFRFGLWNDPAAGAQVGGSPVTVAAVDVVAGAFNAAIDFGADAINGDARWLEIEVQCPGDAGFTLLSPRVELTPAPHATRAVSGVGPPNALEIDSVNGRVGIGTSIPDEPLTVAGVIYSSTGGFRFPDGTFQATADTGDTLGGLSCETGEIAKWDGAAWSCAPDVDSDTDTLAGLGCAAGEVAKWDGAAWACAPDGGGDGHSLDAADGDPIDALYVADDGRVGIGTAAPAQPLHVVGTMLSENPGTSPVGSTVRFGGPSSDPGVVIQRGDGVGGVARQWDVVVEHTNDLEIRDNTAGGVERMVIDTTGRVGIGTISPTEQLDVVGNIHASGTLASGNSITIDGIDNTINATGDLTLQSTGGNVGIGTTTPDELLSVSGAIHSTTGGFKFPDGTVLQTAAYAGGVPPIETISTLLWPPLSGTYPVGTTPTGIAFDGANIWVVNNNSHNVTKLRAADGTNLGTFAVGNNPRGIAFDGVNIWVANAGSDDVTKLRASDGANIGTFAAGDGPYAVAFDGLNIWVANISSDDVTKLRASDGSDLGTFAVGNDPNGLAFDGSNVWVANLGDDTVSKLQASDGANLGIFAVGDGPRGVACDGANIWVANQGSDNVTKLRASDGAVLGTFSVGNGPSGVAFDGTNIWVSHDSSLSVIKLRATDGANMGAVRVGSASRAVAFDGANIWITRFGPDGVIKLPIISQDEMWSSGITNTGIFFDPSPSDDRIGINTNTPSASLHVVGNIVYTGTITDISDERLKENIAPVENATSKIQKLRGVYFNMTDSPDVRDVGLIAQDVQAVLPEAVSVVNPEKGYLGVAYPSVIPLLVEAIKEQDSAIAAKNCEIESLDSEISNLKSEIDELKSLVKALADRHSKGDEQ